MFSRRARPAGWRSVQEHPVANLASSRFFYCPECSSDPLVLLKIFPICQFTFMLEDLQLLFGFLASTFFSRWELIIVAGDQGRAVEKE